MDMFCITRDAQDERGRPDWSRRARVEKVMTQARTAARTEERRRDRGMGIEMSESYRSGPYGRQNLPPIV